MTDARLRELERRWQETQSVEDEAALLRERARTGALRPRRLEVASALGHAAAQLAQPTPPLAFELSLFRHWAGHRDWLPWKRLLHDSGREVAVRMALPVGAIGLELSRDLAPLPRASPVPELEAVLEAADAWTQVPSTERRAAVERAIAFANTLVVNHPVSWNGTTTVLSVGSAVTESGFAACLREAVWWCCTPEGFDSEERLEQVRAAIAAAVVPWALS